jgi:hypothetical protein
LREEFCEEFLVEYFEKPELSEVDVLDALCDSMFVALGGLWKAKLDINSK